MADRLSKRHMPDATGSAAVALAIAGASSGEQRRERAAEERTEPKWFVDS
jgi:hypothetical protein